MTWRQRTTTIAGAALLACSLAVAAGGRATAAGTTATGTPVSAGAATAAGTPATIAGTANWTMAGQDISNTRDQPLETTISAANVARLAVKWSLTTNGDVFDTPAVSNGVLYFTDHG